MAGNTLRPAEQMMRETIEFLLAVPADSEERRRMEEAKTCVFSPGIHAPPWPASDKSSETQIGVVNLGTVEAGELLCGVGLRPAVMSFAHGYNAGGGFEHAGGSQEEDIWRKTSCFLSIWPHRRVDDGPGVLARGMWIGDFDAELPRQATFYPHTDFGGIYSPHVRVIRNTNVRGLPIVRVADLANAPTFGLLTIAAQDLNRTGPFDREGCIQKLRTTFYMAASNGHDAVVVGAFGCGYFRNPPDVVAQIFDELLSGEFRSVFQVVVIAIPDRGGPNIAAFVERFAQIEDTQAFTDGIMVSGVAAVGSGSHSCCRLA